MIEKDQLSAEEMVTIQAALQDRIGDFYFASAIQKIFERIWGEPSEEGIHDVLTLEKLLETDDLAPDQETKISSEDLDEILDSALSSRSVAEESRPFDRDFCVSSDMFEKREANWMIGLSDQFKSGARVGPR